MLFDDEIALTGVRTGGRKVACTLPACVVDDGIPSDSVEGQLSAPCDRFTFFIRVEDWPDATLPHIGDEISRTDGSKFKVTRVGRLSYCFSLNARSR